MPASTVFSNDDDRTTVVSSYVEEDCQNEKLKQKVARALVVYLGAVLIFTSLAALHQGLFLRPSLPHPASSLEHVYNFASMISASSAFICGVSGTYVGLIHASGAPRLCIIGWVTLIVNFLIRTVSILINAYQYEVDIDITTLLLETFVAIMLEGVFILCLFKLATLTGRLIDNIK